MGGSSHRTRNAFALWPLQPGGPRMAQALHPDGHIPITQAAWYRKQTATFRDVLTLVRRHLWGYGTFPTSPTDPGVVLVPRLTFERLSLAVCY